MAAEGLTPGSTLPVWELEAWYQDLQEVLAASEPCGSSLPWGSEQTEMAPLWSTEGAGSDPEGCELDTALAAELLELERTAGSEPLGLLDLASSSSSPPAQAGRGEEEEEEVRVAAGRGVKRKRGSGTGSSKELAKQHQERANEQRVLELTAHNEQLRAEICRLSAEVESTRAALIDRMVNLQTPTPSSHGLQGLCTD
ncbi:DNA damage-inducible transcript 3 protein [Calypte anna]|uniref:DNA damage-inducible transcript 3 protein n=1 Tax=Calypte anna TaxID=9244 RepID=UPI0011C3FB49|nr:DNA damage-inducible transcript 3 protein [Calypte anna]